MTLDPTHHAELLAAVQREFAPAVDDLRALVALGAVSSLPDRRDAVHRAARTVAGLVERTGCDDVQVVDEGGQPAVIARFPAPPGQPTVCLYAHYDVQPTGDPELWTTPPFTATERDGRLYGRGAADDLAGVVLHLAALRAFGGKPPVGVTLFIEGEEEIGSPSLRRLLKRYRTELEADVFVIADSVNWGQGVPAFTTTLRGLAECVVEVRTLRHPLHSGGFGGVAPDAVTSLCRLLATLHDDAGNVAVEGLTSSSAPELEYPEERLRADAGLLDGVRLLGDGSVVERLWTKPAVSVLAIDATSIANASNTLAPTARAKVSMRVAPGDDAQSALRALTEHLTSHAPWGAEVHVTPGETGQPGVVPFEGHAADVARAAVAEAWGVEPVFIGQGGSIPMVADFGDAFPDASVFVTAVTDPDSRAHGIDESVSLADLGRAAAAEALLLAGLAR